MRETEQGDGEVRSASSSVNSFAPRADEGTDVNLEHGPSGSQGSGPAPEEPEEARWVEWEAQQRMPRSIKDSAV